MIPQITNASKTSPRRCISLQTAPASWITSTSYTRNYNPIASYHTKTTSTSSRTANQPVRQYSDETASFVKREPVPLPKSRHVSPAHNHIGLTTAPLAMLPFSMILRSLGTSAISASPLLPMSLWLMEILAHSKNSLLNADTNPILKYLLNRTLYAQFCAGENAEQVKRSANQLKDIGFTGVILAYAKENPKEELPESEAAQPGEETQRIIEKEIRPWAENTLETIHLTQPGDFAALKFTGAGRLALHLLSHRLPPTPAFRKSIEEICQTAQDRHVRILFDGEEDALQLGIDDWTIDFARIFNQQIGRTTIFGTYQAYKKSTVEVLSDHLAQAQKHDFTLGVKLVRGAYLESDPRELFHDSKEATDACYDETAESLLRREWSEQIPGSGEFPHVSLMLATHNSKSVRLAYEICDAGEAKSEVIFAQLQGMADEISCELVEVNLNANQQAKVMSKTPALPVYKYMAWGTTGECMKYLLRRAEENKDALGRARDDRDAMWHELIRRIKARMSLN